MNSVGFNPPKITPGVRFLIFSMLIVLVIQTSFERFADFPVASLFGFAPERFISGSIWQLFTYQFLHGSLTHALFNGVFVYILGSEFEQRWGTKKFLKYYFLCGVGGAILQFIVWFACLYLFPNFADFLGKIPIVGASGAVYGLLVAFGMLFGENYVLVFFVLPMKAKHFVGIIAFIALFSAVFYTNTKDGGGVAHLVHLGGLATGAFYLWWKGPNLNGGGGQGGKKRMSQEEVRRRLSLVVNNENDNKVGDKGMPITWN
jgi:membrane associated rhomboid family serine protease